MNTDTLRAFLVIVELGSLSRAAERLRVAQSTLTRQIQALETELGARLFERGRSGVALTAAGHSFSSAIAPIIQNLETAVQQARAQAQGQSSVLRIGYLQSAAAEFLNPALAAMRKSLPQVKVKLLDLSPGEQLALLRKGELDLALIGNADPSLAKEFFVRNIADLPVAVALPEAHPLSIAERIRIAELRGETFIGARDEDLPGFNHWLLQLCRRAKFKPRVTEKADSLSHALSLVVSEGAVTLVPLIAKQQNAPGVTIRELNEADARWILSALWQRGKTPAAVRLLIDTLARR